jgi:xanthine dehydrogenase accessory factor
MNDSAYSQLQSLLAKGQRAVIATLLGEPGKAPARCCLSGLQIEAAGADPGAAPTAGSALPAGFEPDPESAKLLGQPALLQAARDALSSGAMTWITGEGGKRALLAPSYPSPRMIILGAGHIAIPLAEFGTRLGFSVTVCDDRPSFANKARFPMASRVICDYWPGIFVKLALDPASYVVIVTRGHRYDMDCFRAVAGFVVPYVGMIGSARRIIGVKKQLESEGIPRERLDRLHAPIGLKIGAITPEEIALAIAAEVVAARRTEVRDAGSDSGDAALMAEIAASSDERRALVTVVSSHGSVPRGAGARMLVSPRGEIVGSIGGGCCESEAILAAIDIARSGGYLLRTIDLSGSVAEDEGMACGGSMEILIEEI